LRQIDAARADLAEMAGNAAFSAVGTRNRRRNRMFPQRNKARHSAETSLCHPAHTKDCRRALIVAPPSVPPDYGTRFCDRRRSEPRARGYVCNL